ncbi:unnamed protein product [Allacma fusca]|uniref:Uncharacterized protein n=1 Tax=Allacma fusca TaxID=39272 RepID=A0A8J2KSE6_9HEXA|nr:unnamed protein product [Allacma fusca]
MGLVRWLPFLALGYIAAYQLIISPIAGARVISTRQAEDSSSDMVDMGGRLINGKPETNFSELFKGWTKLTPSKEKTLEIWDGAVLDFFDQINQKFMNVLRIVSDKLTIKTNKSNKLAIWFHNKGRVGCGDNCGNNDQNPSARSY